MDEVFEEGSNFVVGDLSAPVAHKCSICEQQKGWHRRIGVVHAGLLPQGAVVRSNSNDGDDAWMGSWVIVVGGGRG